MLVALLTLAVVAWRKPQQRLRSAAKALLYALTLAVVAWRKPQQRLRGAAKALLYVLTLGLIVALHQHDQVRAEEHAHTVSAAIEPYRQAQGSDPSDLAQLKLPQAGDWRLRYRLRRDGKPLLYRISTLNALDKYLYDFETHEWEFQPN